MACLLIREKSEVLYIMQAESGQQLKPYLAEGT